MLLILSKGTDHFRPKGTYFMNRLLYVLVSIFFTTHTLLAMPLGNPKAPKGGKFVVGFSAYPKSLVYYLSFDVFAATVNSVILESLLDVNPKTYELMPLLAESWHVSKDKKTFTFKINPKAKFSDGKPVTAHDMKFTWDTLLNPKNKTAPFKAMLASFESCKVIDDHTVQFRAKTLHFKNLEKVAGLFILPKHFFSKGNFNKAFNRKLLGSGPYLLKEVKRGERIVLKRNPKYWGATLPQNIGKYNFDKLIFKAVSDYNVQYEIFKRGDIDYFYFLVAKMWATQTSGSKYKNNYIKKLKVTNLSPYSMQGFAWNLRKPLFQDRRVRLALSHLMNRERWIKELFFNQYVMGTGIMAVNSVYRSPKNKPIPYSPRKAKKLLKESGWDKVGSDGVLVKGKQRFQFETLYESSAAERYLTMFQEDLKKMGIKMTLRQVDWTTGLKLTDDRQFVAKMIARGRGVDPSDFAVTWGSDQADIKGSANLTGYKNPEVDKLAQEIDQTFNKKKRIPLVRKLDEIIAHDQPMSFAWEATFYRTAYWNKFSFPGKGYFDYSDWSSMYHYWWYDEAKANKLKKAIGAGKRFKE